GAVVIHPAEDSFPVQVVRGNLTVYGEAGAIGQPEAAVYGGDLVGDLVRSAAARREKRQVVAKQRTEGGIGCAVAAPLREDRRAEFEAIVRQEGDLVAGEARMGEVPVLPQVCNEQPRANGSGEPGNPWN